MSGGRPRDPILVSSTPVHRLPRANENFDRIASVTLLSGARRPVASRSPGVKDKTKPIEVRRCSTVQAGWTVTQSSIVGTAVTGARSRSELCLRTTYHPYHSSPKGWISVPACDDSEYQGVGQVSFSPWKMMSGYGVLVPLARLSSCPRAPVRYVSSTFDKF